MAPQTKPAQFVPRTPQKRNQNERVTETIDKLNRDYNLSIEIPDVTLTPLSIKSRARHDAAFARSEKILSGIRYHCFQPTNIIDKILLSFHMEARAASQKWIRLTDCYEPSQPIPEPPPKAASPGEVLDLQEIMIGILNKVNPQVKPRTFTRAQTDPAAYGSQEVPKTKRRPMEDTKKASPKRIKASPDGEQVNGVISDALDRVPSRSRTARPDVTAARFSNANQGPSTSRFNNAPQLYGNTSVATSASTSRASIFSVANEPLPSTQDTEPAPSCESQKRRPMPAQDPNSSQSQDLFPVSSGHLDALNMSFTEHEAEASSRLITRPPGYAPTPRGDSPGQTTVYSEVSGLDDSALYQPIIPPLKRSQPSDLVSRLDATWPRFPPWLNRAPFAVAWEVTRIALHCGVDLGEVVMTYDETWINQKTLRGLILAQPSFAGKALPERTNADAWSAALSGFKSLRGQHVTFSASLIQKKKRSKTGPIFELTMEPMELDQGCRLHRQFGSDRFLELLIPSPNSWEEPIDSPKVSQEILRWFSSRPHYLAGRQWRAFYTRDAGHKTPQKNVSLGPDPKPIFREKINLFAENGNNFHASIPIDAPSKDDTREQRVKLQVRQMLDWLLQLNDNTRQPFLKLFARIQLGLSKTTPVVVLDRAQIRHRDQDLLSPIGKVMNDGIGRMSQQLARKIKHVLGLSDIPCAIQGRFGPAKGMWIVDIYDSGDELWIETWPSQRKWNCDFHDPEHRTLEIRSHALEPRSASLNVQFLPVLEDRAIDKAAMRKAIGDSLVDELNRELEAQKSAMQYPIQFRQWVNENSFSRRQRLAHNRVPFLGGLPDSSEEVMNFLIDGGFEPRKQKYLQDIAWNLRRTRCENLKKKMSIKIPNSAYFYMVIDFWGILEENEVHVCFSSKFQTETFSDSMLHGCDVLVARSPAHFVSDVQRVKAVFKPELHALKDVVVFSAKGNVPLADKLSGGDYDGDKAWVCWEPAIVSNFVNHDVPPSPDLSSYLKKDKTTYGDLVQQNRQEAVSEMLNRGIAFSMRPSFLGIATNFKERLCYRLNSVNNKYALYLSTLLGNLVDQAKQGYDFSHEDWKQFRRVLLDSQKFRDLEEPAYKSDNWSGRGNPAHIIDYLKFQVAKPTIDKELQRFHLAMNQRPGPAKELMSLRLSRDEEEQTAEYWDADLVKPLKDFETLAASYPAVKMVLKNLLKDLRLLERRWSANVSKDRDDYPRRVLEIYELFCAIEPRVDGDLDPMLSAFLLQPCMSEDRTTWALLRASTAFKSYYNRKSSFVWQMAGIQLQFIKAMATATRDNVAVTVVANLYAALKPDAKFVCQAVSKMREDGSEYPGFESDAEGDFDLERDD